MTSSMQGAILISIHNDILPFKTEASDEMEQDTGIIPPTRTSVSSVYALDAEQCVVGRDPNCQVRVNEKRTDISRRHLTIMHKDSQYIIVDHSLHGTFVNGLRVNGPTRLDSDDIIGLANTHHMLRFMNYDQLGASQVNLTERENEVLILLAAGRTVKEIADDLVISQHTVSSHLKKLYEKLGVNSRSEAVSQGRKLHLIAHI